VRDIKLGDVKSCFLIGGEIQKSVGEELKAGHEKLKSL
jgi:hypothetical protein